MGTDVTMHREFRRLLEDATGEAGFVIAVNADIREFTPFSTAQESPAVAMFIKRVYIKMIDKYFQDATFYKPTGDGLLVVFEFKEKQLQEVAAKVIGTCLQLIADFPTICRGDAMVNFPTPDKIGIGIARGTASRLASGDKILDYSGRVLNLANRLMELARPAGLVFDGAFGIEMVLEPHRALFAKELVYLPGIAQSTPVEVYYTNQLTQIPESARKPPKLRTWRTEVHHLVLGRMGKMSPYVYHLESKPLDSSLIEIRADMQAFLGGKRVKGQRRFAVFENFKYRLVANKPEVTLDTQKLKQILQKMGGKSDTKITIEIIYPED